MRSSKASKTNRVTREVPDLLRQSPSPACTSYTSAPIAGPVQRRWWSSCPLLRRTPEFSAWFLATTPLIGTWHFLHSILASYTCGERAYEMTFQHVLSTHHFGPLGSAKKIPRRFRVKATRGFTAASGRCLNSEAAILSNHCQAGSMRGT